MAFWTGSNEFVHLFKKIYPENNVKKNIYESITYVMIWLNFHDVILYEKSYFYLKNHFFRL